MATVKKVDIGGFNRAREAAVNPVPNRRRPNLASAFEALASGVETLRDVQQADSLARDDLTLVKAQGEFNRSVQEGVAELDPLQAGYADRVQAVFDEARARALETDFETQEAGEALNLALTRASEQGVTSAMADRREALNAEGLRMREQAEDAFLAAVRQDPDNVETHAAAFANQAEAINASLTPEQVRELSEVTGDRTILAQAEGLALQGRVDEARAVLDAEQENLTPETFRAAKQRVRSIEQDQLNQHRAAAANKITDLEIRIIDAQDTQTLSQLRAEVEQGGEDELFKGRPGARATLIRQIESKRQGLIKAQQDVGTALLEVESGLGNTSQKRADLAFSAYMNSVGDDLSAQDRLRAGAEFASKSGFLPSEFKNVVESAERRPEPELLATAASIHQAAKSANPNVDTGAGDRVKAAAVMSETFGMSVEDAAALTVENLPDNAELKARREQFDEQFADFDAAEFLRENDAVTESFLGLGVFGSDAQVPAQAQSDFERMLRSAYDLSGDPEIARHVALNRFGEVYGDTGVGGTLATTKFPAEQALPSAMAANLSREERTELLNGDVQRLMADREIVPGVISPERPGALETFTALTGIATAPFGPSGVVPAVEAFRKRLEEGGGPVVDASGVPEFSLSADDRTTREIVSGRQPTYRLNVRNSYGALVPVGRYVLPTAEEMASMPEYEAIVKRREGQVESRREVQELQRERQGAR